VKKMGLNVERSPNQSDAMLRDFGDAGVAALGQAIRAHTNFAEHTPLALLLRGLAEAFDYPALAAKWPRGSVRDQSPS
jgi:uncharacterized membrane protein YecN with MAPEG domain